MRVWGDRRRWSVARAALASSALLGLTAACTSSAASTSGTTGSSGASGAIAGVPADAATVSLESSHSYTPTTPAGGGTDDYHCTLVDPHVTKDAEIVASEFFPQSPEVHHAILFLVPPSLAAQARTADDGGKGWTCFGESPLPGTSFFQVSNTPWLTAWAPGHGLDVVPKGTAVSLPAGSLVVMQVHYNMLVGDKPVRSKLVLRTVPVNPALHPLKMDLLPAPPDLPCPPNVEGTLCDRTASLADLSQRFGQEQVRFVNFLEGFCGHTPSTVAGANTTSCTWPVPAGKIIRLTAHMHLLGKGMTIMLDPGTPRQKILLNVGNYNFDYQRSYNLSTPVETQPGDRLTVSCTYDPTIRQRLPSLRKLPARYVTWGDGSSDEMCLAIVQYV